MKDGWDWFAVVVLIPVAIFGYWTRYDAWRQRQRKLAAARRKLLDDLRKGRL